MASAPTLFYVLNTGNRFSFAGSNTISKAARQAMVPSVASCRSEAAARVACRRPSGARVIQPLACGIAAFLRTVSLQRPVNAAADWMLTDLWPLSASLFAGHLTRRIACWGPSLRFCSAPHNSQTKGKVKITAEQPSQLHRQVGDAPQRCRPHRMKILSHEGGLPCVARWHQTGPASSPTLDGK